MFKIKEINFYVYTEVKNRFPLVLVEEDLFRLSLEFWTIEGYIYEPYNEIDSIRIPLTFSGLNLDILPENIAALDFKKRYSYKIFAKNIVNPTEIYLAQIGYIDIRDEGRSAWA